MKATNSNLPHTAYVNIKKCSKLSTYTLNLNKFLGKTAANIQPCTTPYSSEHTVEIQTG